MTYNANEVDEVDTLRCVRRFKSCSTVTLCMRYDQLLLLYYMSLWSHLKSSVELNQIKSR